ncbi:GGDEF domain-containing protein [Mesobacillus zeae]|uniref:GGDEF domain-containing protein n=1 Tax=Mesobacillus zeae TaxID=1917180 RepID=A0A398BCX5_9BACI|nr:GGDEF domain-containing protein [Mesobacillus zeae]RID88059.1 GGDEF domain-containing protein [Mesobacillus zeae]
MSTAASDGFILVFGDIDHFKYVNDRYGHMIGDEVLKEIGLLFQVLAQRYNGQAFRYGGEEFAFLLPETDEARLAAFFSDLYKTLSVKTFTSERSVTMSFGAAGKHPEDTADNVLRLADQLMPRQPVKTGCTLGTDLFISKQ